MSDDIHKTLISIDEKFKRKYKDFLKKNASFEREPVESNRNIAVYVVDDCSLIIKEIFDLSDVKSKGYKVYVGSKNKYSIEKLLDKIKKNNIDFSFDEN